LKQRICGKEPFGVHLRDKGPTILRYGRRTGKSEPPLMDPHLPVHPSPEGSSRICIHPSRNIPMGISLLREGKTPGLILGGIPSQGLPSSDGNPEEGMASETFKPFEGPLPRKRTQEGKKNSPLRKQHPKILHPRMREGKMLQTIGDVEELLGPISSEKGSIPFKMVPGPPGAFEEGDGLKAQWTSRLPVSGSSPRSFQDHSHCPELG
jgi:hypothetical protein